MIVRVFRALVHPGKQAEFEAKVRELSIPLVKAQRGLVAFYSGRPLESNPEEFAMVTLWESLAHLKAFAGEDWNHSVIPEEERPLLAESFVHHYQVIDSSQG
ncbi:MAG TPA: antibiotic biosynthesis monooxygenase family protein [Candidatus Angelobacter sp.]|nr:antibiotic biosynthesis monooxygenase family protein [Candidatus Angelobacter sp.]